MSEKNHGYATACPAMLLVERTVQSTVGILSNSKGLVKQLWNDIVPLSGNDNGKHIRENHQKEKPLLRDW